MVVGVGVGVGEGQEGNRGGGVQNLEACCIFTAGLQVLRIFLKGPKIQDPRSTSWDKQRAGKAQ